MLSSRSPTHYPLFVVRLWMLAASLLALGCGVSAEKEPVDVGTSRQSVLKDPPWVEVPPMRSGRRLHVMVGLSDGRVLVAGGASTGDSITSVEVYDPSKNEWSSHPSLRDPRASASAVRLLSGKVLVTGGCLLVDMTCWDVVELYDPSKDTWTDVASQGFARGSHTATLLLDGRVLITGGEPSVGAAALCSTEIYDPAKDAWTKAAPLAQCRVRHTANRLEDGRVLVTGGDDGLGKNLTSAEIYDPAKNSWTAAAPMTDSRAAHTATLLFDGRVFVAGGLNSADKPATVRVTTEIYDPAKNAWTSGPAMAVSRYGHTASRLGNGQVLLAGGTSSDPADIKGLPDTEIFDPAKLTFKDGGLFSTARVFHAATLLDDGRLLVTGGSDFGANALVSGELYTPVSGAPCVAAAECESGFCADGVCCLTACTGACDACKATRGAPFDGLCAPAVDGASCDDHNACTKTSTCKAHTCVGAEPVVCAVSNACHNAVCDPGSGGCLQIPRRDGLACDDHNPCTYSDACHAGFCAGPVSGTSGMVCDAESAPSEQPNGALCGGAEQCASGFCVDGVCCDSACTEPCHACVLPSAVGTCSLSPVGVDLRHECDPLSQCLSTCGPDGACIGADAKTQCLPAECIDEQHSLTPVLCSAAGAACSAASRQVVDCAPSRCEIATGSCREACRSVHDCADGYVCDAAYRCVPPPPRDGGEDAGCSVARGGRGDGATGWLLGLFAALILGRRRAPGGAARAALRFRARSRAASGVALSLSAVSGLGCSAEAEPPSLFSTPSLLPLGNAAGYPCLSPAECASGSCMDGVCCATPCADDGCHVCSKAKGAAEEGACTGLSGVACDDHNLCTLGSVCQNGACVGVKPLVCPASSPCSDGYCDLATGACVERAKSEGASCDDGDSCTTADICKKGACAGVRGSSSSLCGTGITPGTAPVLGAPCKAGDECPSGFCADGVCCDSPCEEACHSCAVPGSLGVCTAEALGLDLRHDCGASVECLRTCGGNGACVDSSSAAQCDPPRCLGEHQSLAAALCPAKGAACPLETERAVSDCSPYACETASGSCLRGCRSVHDCAAGFVCDSSAHCVPPPSASGGDDGGCRVAVGRAIGEGSSVSLGLGLFALIALWRRGASAASGRRRTAAERSF